MTIEEILYALRGGFQAVLQGESGAEWAALTEALPRAVNMNGWFAEDQLRGALQDWVAALSPDNVADWLHPYSDRLSENRVEQGGQPKVLALITAGNLPWVGLHDILCAVVAGHCVKLRLSRDDAGLTSALLAGWTAVCPGIGEQIELVERLDTYDAVIATGSNSTRQHFERYFAHVPHIIRGQRSGVAVLSGEESHEELVALSEDMFRYFGLGCRSVSKIYVPAGFDLNRIFAALVGWSDLQHHHRFVNNYTYHKALWLLEAVDLLENGFVLFKRDEALASPVATLYWDRYEDVEVLNAELALRADEIQCRIGLGGRPYGSAQRPGLAEYADGVDTLQFLLNL